MSLSEIRYNAPKDTLGIVIQVNGEIRVANPDRGKKKDYTFGQIREIINGYFQIIDVSHLKIEGMKSPLIMLVNEEARMLPGFEINPTASLIVGYPILGDVLITNKKMVK